MKIVSIDAENFIAQSIENIISSTASRREKLRQFAALLDLPPHREWVELHPSIKNHAYVPISRVEGLLRLFFGTDWRVRVLSQGQLFNSVQVTVRLHYVCPITGEKHFQDGVGAKELQTKAGSGALQMDFSNINKSAVEMAIGIAKSVAIKDAADMIGRIFGSDVNRTKSLQFGASIALNQTWQAFKPEDAENVEVRAQVDYLLNKAEEPAQINTIFTDKVVPYLRTKGVQPQLFYAIAADKKKQLEAVKIPQFSTHSTGAGDVGDLTEKQLLMLQMQQDE